jgi:hypothetical protein
VSHTRCGRAPAHLFNAALCFAIASCGDTERRDADSSAGGTTIAEASVGRTIEATPRKSDDSKPTPELPRHWRSMTSAEMRVFIDSALSLRMDKPFTTDHRKCAGTSNGKACNLTIWPIEGMRHVKVDGPVRKGIVMAMIRNDGTATEQTFNIKAGQTVYWLSENSNSPVSRLLDLSGNNPISVRDLKFTACTTDTTHPKPPHASTFAAFRNCIDMRDTTSHTSPPWIACATGCCYADQS